MPVSVTMPRLGESVTEGTVTRWLKHEGDRVEADEPLLEVSTDKVDTEIPSPASGVLTRIVVGEDETVEVGSELAVIDDGDAGSGGAPAQDAVAGEARPAGDPAEVARASQDGGNAAAAERGWGAHAAGAPDADTAEADANAAQADGAGQAASQSTGSQSTGSQSTGSMSTGTQTAGSVSTAGQDGSAPGPSAPAAGGATTVVRMPALGESVTEGTVTRWLKQVGESVEADEALLEVSTDKVDTEIPSPVAGTVLEIKVPEDETVAVGADLAVIGTSGEAPAGPPAARTTPPQQAAPAQPPAPAPQPAPPATPSGAATPQVTSAPAAGSAHVDGDEGAYLTPLVRKLAAEHGVNLGALTGTGVGGRIRKQDVLAAAEQNRAAAAAPAPTPVAVPAAGTPKPAAAPSPLRGRTEKMTRMRAVIARRMVESLQISAQLTTVVEVDVTKIARLRDQAKADFAARHGVKLSFLPFFALASVEALRVHPNVNASIDMEAGTVTYHDAEHLGMAVDTERGLMVPVIRDAGDLNLAGLARRIADLAERTRTNKVTPDELSGGTFTLTNTGSRGALFDTPIINQPQVGILGTGAVVRRAVVVDDAELGEIIVPRSMVYLALSYDHRIVDGADAARFLTAVKERLEAGNFEPDLGL